MTDVPITLDPSAVDNYVRAEQLVSCFPLAVYQREMIAQAQVFAILALVDAVNDLHQTLEEIGG